jgi:hypothetical protein
MTIKYTRIFHSKAVQNFTQIWIFGLKTNHLATLFATSTSEDFSPDSSRIDGQGTISTGLTFPPTQQSTQEEKEV